MSAALRSGEGKNFFPEALNRYTYSCGIGEELLNMYGTAEPFAYYAHTRDVPQNILILENKDTFYSMRRVLLNGKTAICGMETGTLIYGAGKRVIRSFQEFDLCAEPYMKQDETGCIISAIWTTKESAFMKILPVCFFL